MTRLCIALFVIVCAAPSIDGQNANDLFQKALSKERAEGQLDEAIQLYERIVKEFAADRPLAAKALLQMGRCYERLGKTEAQKAYERLVREFADQRAVADEARARLAEIARGRAPAGGVSVRLVWSGEDVDTQGTVSPDGRYLSFVDVKTGDLAVRDLTTGQTSRLTEGEISEPSEMALLPVMARDGRQVAFTWFGKDGMFELRAARIGRPRSKLVYRNPEVVFVEPFAWSEDGRRVIASLERKDGTVQIAMVSVADGSVRVLKSFNWQWPQGVSLSPDGRFIVYALPPAADSLKHDVFLLATDGSREVPLVQHPADDMFPLWTPDGSGVVFVSDRSGSLDAWFVRVADGRLRGEATMVKQNLGRGHPMGFTRDGALYYGAIVQSLDVYVAAVDPESGRVTPATSPIAERFVGSNFAPDWSPDGARLSYVSQRGVGGPGSSAVVVKSMADGSERELVPHLRYFHRPRWARDGHTIVVQGLGLKGPTGLYGMDAETGRVAVVVKSDAGSFAAHQTWSPDGKTLFYTSFDMTGGRIVARDVATGVERDLDPRGGGEKAVSPDGKWLAFTFVDADRSTTYVRLVPTAGGPSRDLVTLRRPEGMGAFGGVSWTPDGKRLLFVKQREGDRRELWQVDVESGRTEPTGLAAVGLQYVRLHPDGRQVAYSAGKRQDEVWVIERLLPPAPARTTASATRK